MIVTNEKQCPKCKSINFQEMGLKMVKASRLPLSIEENPSWPKKFPSYKCRNCGEEFIVKED